MKYLNQINILLVSVGIVTLLYAFSQTYWQAASNMTEGISLPLSEPGGPEAGQAGREPAILSPSRGDMPEKAGPTQGESVSETPRFRGDSVPAGSGVSERSVRPTPQATPRRSRPVPPSSDSSAGQGQGMGTMEPSQRRTNRRALSPAAGADGSGQQVVRPALPAEGAAGGQKRGAGDDPPPPPVRSSMPEQRPPR